MVNVKNFSFTVILEQGDEQWIAYCPEVPEANGQGSTKAKAIDNLKEAVLFALDTRREDALRGAPPDAVCEKLSLA